jgi:uncharacterized membrane protein YecN with MAPEG domain
MSIVTSVLSRPGILCSAILGGMTFILGLSVSLARQKELRSIGCDADNLESALTKRIRAHTNHIEYSPVRFDFS